jgi:hypothetical protein
MIQAKTRNIESVYLVIPVAFYPRQTEHYRYNEKGKTLCMRNIAPHWNSQHIAIDLPDVVCSQCEREYEKLLATEICCKCLKPATWMLTPTNDLPNPFWCDKCVPRNCKECNELAPKDEQWRPCVEFCEINKEEAAVWMV